VRIWSIETGEVIRTLSMPEPVNDGDVSADGRLLAGTGTSATYILNVETGEILQTIRSRGVSQGQVAFSPDGKTLASITHTTYDPPANKVNVWDTTTGQLLFTLADPATFVFSVAFSPDGSKIATASNA